MEYRALGSTGLMVSRLAFGGLTVGPLQANMSPEAGGRVIRTAFEHGVNLIDTAELYQTYSHIRSALKGYDRTKIHICSKSYAYDRQTAQDSIEKALKELGTDYIDVFLLHEQESVHTIRGHYEALEHLLRLKEVGVIRAVGLSTHYIAGVEAAIKYKEIDVVHPIVNISGLGIQDGTIEKMLEVLSCYKDRGGGIFGMKPFGGGNLLHSFEDCLNFVLSCDVLDSIAVGMQSVEEVKVNSALFSGQQADALALLQLSKKKKTLMVHDWCTGCGACERRCQHKAIRVVEGKAQSDVDRCVLCGYCSAVCPEFCIKVI